MDRFSKLFGNSAVKRAQQKLSTQLNKKAIAVEANGNGTSGILLQEGQNAGKILKHLKTDKNKL